MDGFHLEEQKHSPLSSESIIGRVDSQASVGSLSSHSSMGDRSTSSSMTSSSYQYASHENAVPSITHPGDGGSNPCIPKGSNGTSNVDGSDEPVESPNEEETTESLDIIGTDSSLWMPPEPEDAEDDSKLSVADIDDDDDYGDGTQWTVSSSFDAPDDGIILNYKKERQKAIMDAIDGQFKLLVGRFLASEGIAFPEGGVHDDWLDIVADLSVTAALLVKPHASEGKAMDPASYIKIKCIASGSPTASLVIKGLVFKKNAAHKHMPTKFKNPRLLLFKGILGERAKGLSSFDLMEQEKGGYLKPIKEMIDTCNPNVVLVEKTVSRDVQEFLLAKGITLVFDMKMPRLEKIARCTGSEIISSADFAMNIKLKQCGYFHIEKVVEEHNSSDGGKKPSKTLMYFDGCTKPLGCTVLLKGAPSDELKKIKRVMHFTVFAAYHLILETSFFADQKAISFVPNDNGDEQNNVESKLLPSSEDMISLHSNDVTFQVSSNGFSARSSDDPDMTRSQKYFYLDKIHQNQSMDNGRVSAALLSGFDSVSGDNFVGSDLLQNQAHFDKYDSHEVSQQDQYYYSSYSSLLPGQLLSFPPPSREVLADRPYYIYDETMPLHPGSKETEPGSQYIQASNGFPSIELDSKVNPSDVVIDRAEDQASHIADVLHSSKPNEPQMREDVESMLDSHSILVLFSSRCISKDIICEESHLSRIKYYGNFDMSLGRFLKDILLNERHKCARCGEPPEAHIYSYTHQNGKLTVQVKKLHSRLPGEAEGKIWMWTRCLKCQNEDGTLRTSRRVAMSSEARSLSFGKFLELSFSSHSAAKKLSRCGHLLHRDCLRFFGFNTKVAAFKYSPVVIYKACKPPPVLEFSSSVPRLEWLEEEEVKDVRAKGERFFLEVENALKELKPKCAEQQARFQSSRREFSEVENILILEKEDFEASLHNATGYVGQAAAKAVNTAYLYEELLLGLYVWDHRIHFLLSFEKENTVVRENGQNAQKFGSEEGVEQFPSNENNSTENCEEQSNGQNVQQFVNTHTASFNVDETCDVHAKDVPIIDAKQGSFQSDLSGSPFSETQLCLDADTVDIPITDSRNGEDTIGSFHEDRSTVAERDIPIGDGDTPNFYGQMKDSPYPDELDVKAEDTNSNHEKHDIASGVRRLVDDYASTMKLKGDNEDWLWNPFPEIYKALLKESYIDYCDIFAAIRCYKSKHMPLSAQMIAHEREQLAYPIGTEGVVISIHEEEVSSIIACGLTFLYDRYTILDSPPEKDMGKDRSKSSGAVTESMQRLLSDGFMSSLFSSSNGSIERILSYQSLPSSFDEVSSISEVSHADRLFSSEKLHPEIVLENIDKKTKYSVVCIHAKLFYDLRRRCCPSESAYISSLSRCKRWDVQGGKSKALFAKTLDDRFIIKEIKKTELESFLKFAPEYFKHVSLSLDTGSQTCLAKILGIYQVRQIKNGKEIKSDLMVMENLLYGRNVSRTYDLKGAVYARYISDPNNPEKVLLDQNFVEDMGLSPMYIGGRTKQLLTRAIWNDTSFLTTMNVMDYSLLLGVDKHRRELVFGIIDYLRQYTWDKQLETWVKSSLVIPRNSLPTVISPKEYKKRFRKFMSKYFLTVPDSWTDSTPDPSKSLDGRCTRTDSEESLHRPNSRSDSEESLHKQNHSAVEDPHVTGD